MHPTLLFLLLTLPPTLAALTLPNLHPNHPNLHPLTHINNPSNGTGQTFEFCRVPTHCKSPRTCITAEGNPNNCTDQFSTFHPGLHCHCIPSTGILPCTDATDCESGEVCATTFYTEGPVCVSAIAEKSISWIEKAPPVPSGNPSPTPLPRPGLTFDKCLKDCLAPRSCLYTGYGTNYTECAGVPPCKCMLRTIACFTDRDCVTGEECSENPIFILPVCVSRTAVLGGSVPKSIDNPRGLTFDPCDGREDCVGGRSCISFNDLPNFILCYGSRPCLCALPKPVDCKSSADCEDGEVCAISFVSSGRALCFSEEFVRTFSGNREVGDGGDGPKKSVGPEPTGSTAPEGDEVTFVESSSEPSPTPAQGGVCVDVRLLRGVPREGLVFREDVLAEVLCDREGSCATEGHIVLWRERGMMMKTYCKEVGCVKRALMVNSPRWRVGVRIGSRSEGLGFSAFAARFGTWGEEALLAAAVRSGL